VTSRGFFLRRRVLLSVAAAVLAASAPAAVEEVPAPPLPVAASSAAVAAAVTVPATNRAVLMPGVRSADIQLHWTARREYVRDRDERRADDEDQRVRSLKDELAIENLFSVGAALVRESRLALRSGATAVAVQRCKLAVDLSPSLPAAHICLARASFAESPASLKQVFTQFGAAAAAAWSDPRISRALIANGLSVVFIGSVVAGFAFVIVLLLRHASLYAHDVHHLVPGGTRRGWQARMLAAVLLLSPVLLQMGPLPLVFTALLACALYATTAEVVISISLLLGFALSPWAAEGIGQVAAFSGPAADVWLVEHGEGTGPEIARLQKRLETVNELPVSFALARKAKRDGDLVTAEKLYLKALEVQGGASSAGLAAVRNNLGNVYLLQGDGQKAVAQYQQAIDLKETLAAPHFNISRALAMGGVDTLEKVQAEQARALQLDRALVESFTGGQLQANRKSNKFLLDVPLDVSQLDGLLELQERAADLVGDEVRAQLAGNLPAPMATVMPILAAILVIALRSMKARIRPSGCCDRCGREVCRRCDADARPTEALCAQCVNVFIRRNGVDAQERMRKESLVEAYHRRRHLMVRTLAVLSGAGHLMMGQAVRGMFYLLVTASLLSSVVLWRGVTHDPLAVGSGVSFARVALTALLFIGVYAICLRDVLARQRAEEGA
jgi:tetratricopeptide (TPR) repeat protein